VNQKQPQILRLTTPRLKSTPGAPFAQDDSFHHFANYREGRLRGGWFGGGTAEDQAGGDEKLALHLWIAGVFGLLT